MATKYTLFSCLLIIISHYVHHTTSKSTTLTPKAPAQELHLYYIRHVHSRSNAFKVAWWRHISAGFHRDVHVAHAGAIQLKYILDHFADKMYDELSQYSSWKNTSFEASTLRRTAWTLLSVRRSLINKGEKTLKATTSQQATQEQLKKKQEEIMKALRAANVSIVQDLQETPHKDATWFPGQGLLPSKAKPSTSKFEQDTNTKKSGPIVDCNGFERYFTEAIPDRHMTEKMKGEIQGICKKTDYVKATRWTTNDKVAKNTEEKFIYRIEDYGKRLKQQINAGKKVLIVAGHGAWFREFVKEFGAKKIKTKWGEYKLFNGEMVHMVIKPNNGNNKPVGITKIEKKFKAKPETK